MASYENDSCNASPTMEILSPKHLDTAGRKYRECRNAYYLKRRNLSHINLLPYLAYNM
jgi:hypothetical protein